MVLCIYSSRSILSIGKLSPSPNESLLWTPLDCAIEHLLALKATSEVPGARITVPSIRTKFSHGTGSDTFPWKAQSLFSQVVTDQLTELLLLFSLSDTSQSESLNVWHLEYDRHILKSNYCPLTDTYFQCKFKNRTFCHQLISQDAELPRFTLISSESDSSDWQPDDLYLSEVPSSHDFPFFQS